MTTRVQKDRGPRCYWDQFICCECEHFNIFIFGFSHFNLKHSSERLQPTLAQSIIPINQPNICKCLAKLIQMQMCLTWDFSSVKEIGLLLFPNLILLPVCCVAYGVTIDSYLGTYRGTFWGWKHCFRRSSQSISRLFLSSGNREGHWMLQKLFEEMHKRLERCKLHVTVEWSEREDWLQGKTLSLKVLNSYLQNVTIISTHGINLLKYKQI